MNLPSHASAIRRLLTAASLLALLGVAQAQTTSTIAFQGRVTGSGGGAPADDVYPMSFTLLNAQTLGDTLWTETVFNVPVSGGLFTHQLGSTTPFPEGLFADESNLFLEIAIDVNGNGLDAGDVQSPRIPLNATPIAFYAKDAGSLGGTPAEDYAKSADVYTRTEADGQFANAGIVDVFNDFKDEYNELIVTKADQSTVDSALAAKADQSSVNSALATKANVSALFQWNVVIGGPVAMQPNRGYMANSATELNFNLPASGTLTVGDIVRVSGIGAGGWRIAQDTGQSVRTSSLPVDDSWKKRTASGDWYTLASSADGSKLVAAVLGNRIFTSADFGVTWTPRESNRFWRKVASSADGTKLVAVVEGGQIYTSPDSGVTWGARDSNRTWRSVASSADGNKLVAAEYNGNLYTSTDSGVSWTPRASIRAWFNVASSADGTKLVAVTNPGQIYTSTDSGITWTPRETDRGWFSVASSADGSTLVTVAGPGQLYVSIDSGITWVPRGAVRIWTDVAIFADGMSLLASVSNGQIYRSDDVGLTWAPLDIFGDWGAIASSADGTRLVAAEAGGSIYTYSGILERSTAGITGGISGPANSAIELQYIGNGEFLPLSSSGMISAF